MSKHKGRNPTSRYNIKGTPRRGKEAKIRICNRCDKEFLSLSRGNRRCAKCHDDINEANSRYSEKSVYGTSILDVYQEI